MASESKLDELASYETSTLFTERERVALRYTDAICWDPSSADGGLWEQLHQHFTDPELVELGSFIGYIAGGQRWIKTLGIANGEFMAQSTVGLSPSAKETVGEQAETAPIQ
ncbi:MAG: carboxymuconolactone decarboxylase family protein [Solirubrobacteraceae bacterium]